MKNGYFHRISQQSNTKFWINNPTRDEADLAIKEGACSCTLNPSYSQKMLDHPDESEYAYSILDQVIDEVNDDIEVATEFQRRLAKPICEKFLPVFEKTNHEQGYVSIQGDPVRDEDHQVIIDEARLNYSVAPNVCNKIPATASGFAAMEVLIPENHVINATEIFAVQQGLDLGELYERLIPKGAIGPKLFYSHIAGIYDQNLAAYVEEHNISISSDILVQAGLAVARKLYFLVKDRGYRMSFIGGGARGLHHFTELVGGDVNLTINWKGTADKLLEQNPPVIYRIFNPVPYQVIDELMQKLPDFKRGYQIGGLHIDEYEEFPPVQLFRSSFIKSWEKVLKIINDRRKSRAQ